MALTLQVVGPSVSHLMGKKYPFNKVAHCSYMSFQHLLQLVAENTRFQLATPGFVLSLNLGYLWLFPFTEVLDVLFSGHLLA
jgi:hypothetical protein